MTKSIIIADHDIYSYKKLVSDLERNGFTVFLSRDSEQLFPDIVPDLGIISSTFAPLIRELFKSKKNLPLIMVGDSRDEKEVLGAFEEGAADYIVKPFSEREFIARIRTILRRIDLSESQRNEKKIKLGALTLYPERFQIQSGSHRADLTKKELKLLQLLIKNKDTIISRDQILHEIWGFEYDGDPRIVDIYISSLRQKVEENTRRPQYIKTIRGLGYRLDEPIIP